MIRAIILFLIWVGYVTAQGTITLIDCDMANDTCPPGSRCTEYQDGFTGNTYVTCHCEEDYFVGSDGYCMKLAENGENCSDADNIYCADSNAACTEGTCQCIDPYYVSDDGSCVQDGSINDHCNDTVMCSVSGAECQNNTCVCVAPYELNGNQCTQYAGIQEACSDEIICRSALTECSNSMCECITNYEYDSSTNECVTNVTLGQACGPLARCVTEFSECNGTCTCLENYIVFPTSCVATSLELENSLEVSCERTSDCESYRGSICVQLPNGEGGTHGQCVCDTEGDWFLDSTSDLCMKTVQNLDFCDLSVSVCADEHAECRLTPGLTSVWRCECKEGYILAEGICAKIITVLTDPECADCYDNDGTCYDADFDDGVDRRTGCHCLLSAIGENCGTVLLTVKCLTDSFQLIACYDPHEGYDFENGVAMMYTEEHGNTMDCRGTFITEEDSHCLPGQVQIVLPMDEENRGTCGTTNRMIDMSRRLYENTLVVQASSSDYQAPMLFDVYCEYMDYSSIGHPGLSVHGVPGNDRGEFLQPHMTFDVQNPLNENVPEGVALRIGDDIRLRVTLDDDGTYTALRVESCLAASAPDFTDSDTQSLQLTIEGCPWSGQNIIDDTNNWRLIDVGSPNAVQTGYFDMFGLGDGQSVFIHCWIKLCLVGNEGDCAPHDCDYPHEHQSFGRKKREATDDGLAEVTRELIWFAEEENGVMTMEQSTFAAIICILVLLLLAFILLALVLLWRLCVRHKVIEDMPPQRFALPRMNSNPHTRFHNSSSTANLRI